MKRLLIVLARALPLVALPLAALAQLPGGSPKPQDHDPLTGGSVAAGDTKAAPCGACHGPQGNVALGAPKLMGQGSKYIYEQLKLYKAGKRVNVLMNAQAANLTDADMRDLAAHFTAQKAVPGLGVPGAAQAAEHLYRAGDPARALPACAACHGPTGAGNAGSQFPRLGGQNTPYIVTQLTLYKNGTRHPVTPQGKAMNEIAGKLSDQEITALAGYVAGLQ